MSHSVMITGVNPALSNLELSWRTPEFSAENGMGPMASLHQAGDALVAVAEITDLGLTVHGSGVMVAPGLLLTATHVLDEFPRSGSGPVFITFLPEGARAWLPLDVSTVSGPSQFYEDRKVISDISLVSCTLNSDAYPDCPLMLAPMKVALPLLGERLWAIGFRHHALEAQVARLTPLISSGPVTAAFPNGRGEHLRSPCIEVALETLGGMSGGAVVNADGQLIGIVSASVEGGPSIVTLIWEALRFRVKGSIPKLRRHETVSLLGANAFGLARLKGDVNRNPWGDVTVRLSPDENELLLATAEVALAPTEGRGLTDAEIAAFVDQWGPTLERLGSEATIQTLGRFSPDQTRTFLTGAGIPAELLASVTGHHVEDFDGVEDLEVVSARDLGRGRIEIDFYFEMQMLVWTLAMPEADYVAGTAEFAAYFDELDIMDGVARVELFQRGWFRGKVEFEKSTEGFSEVVITSSAIRSGPMRPAASSKDG